MRPHRIVTMLMVLCIPLLVAAEWVEIAQNQYRKEPYHKSTHIYEETTANNAYNNHSTVTPEWRKGYVQRIPNAASVERTDEGDRKTVEIEYNPVSHDDLVTIKPDGRFKINKFKSGSSIFERDHNRNNESFENHFHPAFKNNLHHENTSRNILVFSDKNNHQQLIQTIEPKTANSDKFTNTDEIESNKNQDPESVKILKHDVKKESSENLYKIKIDKTQKSGNTNYNKDLEHEDVKKTPTLSNEDKIKNKTKTNAMETLIKFLKVVSQTINLSTRRSFDSKVRYLENLKETLLASIENRIDLAFPDDNSEQQRRRRAAGAESRGHVEFPSSESALMTISFLTFAVFLIKLVLIYQDPMAKREKEFDAILGKLELNVLILFFLRAADSQVIHTYKAKTMMVTPAVVATVGRAAAAFQKSASN